LIPTELASVEAGLPTNPSFEQNAPLFPTGPPSIPDRPLDSMRSCRTRGLESPERSDGPGESSRPRPSVRQGVRCPGGRLLVNKLRFFRVGGAPGGLRRPELPTRHVLVNRLPLFRVGGPCAAFIGSRGPAVASVCSPGRGVSIAEPSLGVIPATSEAGSPRCARVS
jgi:hypothetical protein